MAQRLEITSVTKRIIVLLFPNEGYESLYTSDISNFSQHLKLKYENHYMIVNISERRYDLTEQHKKIIDFGWPDGLAPSLERLCNICKCIDSWLNVDQKNLIVLHCKGGLGRMAVVLSAYSDYSSICPSEEQLTDQFAIKNYYETKLKKAVQPSQKRYMHYFAGLLNRAISINNSSLFLHQIVIKGIPNFDGRGSCQPYIKIYQGLNPVYVSGVFSPSSTSQIILTLEPSLQLRSDILIKCYNKSATTREIIFGCQFHTCAITNNNLLFSRIDLDEACVDPRFPSSGSVELIFSLDSTNYKKYECLSTERNILIGSIQKFLEKSNSYENFSGQLEDICFTDMKEKSSYHQEEKFKSNKAKLHSSSKVHTNNKRIDSNHINQENYQSSSSMKNAYEIKENKLRDDFKSMKIDDQRLASTSLNLFGNNFDPINQKRDDKLQLEEILKELLEVETSKTISNQSQMSKSDINRPHQGAITTENDNMRSILSWNTEQAGGQKRATVSRQTLANPSPQSRLHSEITRSREIIVDDLRVKGGKLLSTEQYSCNLPNFQESRNVEEMSERKIYNTSLDKNENYIATGSGMNGQGLYKKDRHYVSDSEDQISWLKNQKNNLINLKEGRNNNPMERKFSEMPLKNNQRSKKAVSDTEDFDMYNKYANSRRGAKHGGHEHFTSYESKNRKKKYETIETETFSRKSETTSHFAGGNQLNKVGLTPLSAIGGDQKQLMPPMGRYPSPTPVIPDRDDSSREAFLKAQKFVKPIDYPSENKNIIPTLRAPLAAPVEVEVISLQPIGPGVQPLEPRSLPKSAISSQNTMPARGYGRGLMKSTSIPAFTTLESNRQTSINNRSNSRLENWPTGQTFNPQAFQRSAFIDTVKMEKKETQSGFKPTSSTMPRDFNKQPSFQQNLQPTPQPGVKSQVPIVQSYRESQTWSSKVQPPMLASTGNLTVFHQNPPQIQAQQYPTQRSGSVQYVNQHQRTSSQNVESGFNVPVLIQNNQISNGPSHTNTYNSSNIPTIKIRGLSTDMPLEDNKNGSVFINQSQTYRATNSANTTGQYPQQMPSSGEVFTGGTSSTLGLQNGLSSSFHAATSSINNRSRVGSVSSFRDSYDLVNQPPKFIHDTSRIWHRPNFSREDAIQYLKEKQAGSFVIRNSSTYENNYVLTLKVVQIPNNVLPSRGDPNSDLVRHFIIEPTPKGVQLKSTVNEPPFASLAAFVYQHSLTTLSLPCKLLIPELDAPEQLDISTGTGYALDSINADCNVLYIGNLDTESLTGPEALSRTINQLFNNNPIADEVNIKASAQGITITNCNRREFFRKHYQLNTITYLGMDDQERKYNVTNTDGNPTSTGRVFGFVARKQGSVADNTCHLFAELETNKHSAESLINFITQLMVSHGRTVTRTSHN